MSYILEALKKAEAERRGGKHVGAALLPSIAAPSRTPPAWRRPLPSAGLATLAVALACAAWFAASRSGKQPAAPSAAAPAAEAVMPAPPPPVQAAAVVQPPPAPEAAAETKPAPKRTARAAPARAEKKRAPAADMEQPAGAAEAEAGLLKDLPEHIRREIPSISVGGYIYSANKADRSVLVNKRLLREGDEIAPGLVLERMQPNGMILNYKGYRYRSAY